jgi:ATP-binding cassette subfamily B protein
LTPNAVRYELFHPRCFGRALRMVWSASPRWTAAVAALAAGQAALPVLTLYLYKLVIDRVERGVGAGVMDFGPVAWLIGLAALAALAGNGLQAWSRMASEVQGHEVADHMLALLQEKATALDLACYEDPAMQDVLHRAHQEAATRPVLVVRGLLDLARNGLSLLLLGGLLVAVHAGAAFLLAAAGLPAFFLQLRYANEIYLWRQRATRTERQANYLHWLLTGAHGAREVRLFDLGPFFRSRFRTLRSRLRAEKQEVEERRVWLDFLSEAGSTLALFAAFAGAAGLALQGTITLGTLVVVYQVFQQGRVLLNDFVVSLGGFYQHNLFLSQVYDLLDRTPRVREPAQPQPVPRPLKRGFVFEQVSFRYPGGKANVLEKLNLTIEPEKVTALVGHNGSGKTTLVKLLCRYYDPTEGRITLDGVDLRDFPLAELRRQLSVLFQDYVWYHLLSARENIGLGDAAAPPDEELIRAAASASGADEFIQGLPEGYNTILGNQFANGQELSIGQWQRVALARAFYRRAQVLVLDEPSSALDPLAEADVFARFGELARGQTAILVSHRLSNIIQADCIYVLKGGQVVESGVHEQLVRAGGTYHRLFEAQAQSYRHPGSAAQPAGL